MLAFNMVAPMMTIERPRHQRVHVQIRNPLTGTSKTLTLYGVDEVQAAEQIRRMVERSAPATAGDETDPDLSRACDPVSR